MNMNTNTRDINNSSSITNVETNNGHVENNDNRDQSKHIEIHHHLTVKEKKKKEKKEEANRYGLRKIIEEGLGGYLISGDALVRLDKEQKVKNKENHLTFINVHSLDGKYLTDHTHIPKSDITSVKIDEEVSPTLGRLLYVRFVGRPYNYNEERYDGLSIKVGRDDGGVVQFPSQFIEIKENQIHKYEDINETTVNDISKYLKYSAQYNEYLSYIEFFKMKINHLTFPYVSKNFIYDYIIYSYFLELSHKSLYLDNINFNDIDENCLIDIIILLASTLIKLQEKSKINIPELFQYIGYRVTSIQFIKSFNNYYSEDNNNFRRIFEPMINRKNSWEVIEHRKSNLQLNYSNIPLYDDVFYEGYKVIWDLFDDMSLYYHNKKDMVN